MANENLPPLLKGRFHMAVPGSVDVSRYCKVTSLLDHPVMQWLKAVSSHRKEPYTARLPGFGLPTQEWIVLESDFRWFGNHFAIDALTEREGETLEMLMKRGEVIVIVYEQKPDGAWAPSSPR